MPTSNPSLDGDRLPVLAASSPRAGLAGELGAELADRLPVNRHDQFASAAAFAEGDDPARWARRASSLFDLIKNPGRVLAELGKAQHRQV